MLTAEKARELAGVNEVEAVLGEILAAIELCAKDRLRQIEIRDFGFGTDYLYDGKSKESRKAVISRLNSLGFKTMLESPAAQFEDHYLLISW